MTEQKIVIRRAADGVRVTWCDNAMLNKGGALSRVFETESEAREHADMVADQFYFEDGQVWRIENE